MTKYKTGLLADNCSECGVEFQTEGDCEESALRTIAFKPRFSESRFLCLKCVWELKGFEKTFHKVSSNLYAHLSTDEICEQVEKQGQDLALLLLLFDERKFFLNPPSEEEQDYNEYEASQLLEELIEGKEFPVDRLDCEHELRLAYYIAKTCYTAKVPENFKYYVQDDSLVDMEVLGPFYDIINSMPAKREVSSPCKKRRL